MTTTAPVATWRKVLAAILDFLTVFFVGGYAIGSITGQTTEQGFNLQGGSALLLFGLIVAYFVLGTECSAELSGNVSSPPDKAQRCYSAAVSFFTAAEILWRKAWKPFDPSLVIQFI